MVVAVSDSASDIPIPGAPAAATPSGPASQCLLCGYDLRGLAERRCPECGTPFDPSEPGVPWGPLLWESPRPIPAAHRLYHTLTGLVFHPLVSMKHLGAAPRKLGRCHVVFLVWLPALCIAMALISTAVYAVAFQYLEFLGKAPKATPLTEEWLRHQIAWLDSVVSTILHGGIVLTLAGLLTMLSRDRDTNRELAMLAGLLAIVVASALLAPAHEALIPVIAVAAGTAGLVVYQFDQIGWARIVSHSVRGMVYIVVVNMFFGLYLSTIGCLIAVADQQWGPSPMIRSLAARTQSAVGTGLLCLILYWFIRGTFHVGRLRAVGAAIVYAVLAEMWLYEVEITQSPLTMVAQHVGWIPLR